MGVGENGEADRRDNIVWRLRLTWWGKESTSGRGQKVPSRQGNEAGFSKQPTRMAPRMSIFLHALDLHLYLSPASWQYVQKLGSVMKPSWIKGNTQLRIWVQKHG